MASAQQKIYDRLGINENTIKNNKLFSPPKKNLQKINPVSLDQSRMKTEASVSSSKNYFSSNNILKSSKPISNAFETCKIDILVPNSEPPKPQIQSIAVKYGNTTTKSSSTAKTSVTMKDFKSPEKTFTSPVKAFNKDFKKNNDKSILEDLHHSKKICNNESFCPVSKAHKLLESKTSSKNLL